MSAANQCRTDGRCQYAIDHGAEGLGHCPEGKCCMPADVNAHEHGGPAFPIKQPVRGDWDGMNLRDYFAIRALDHAGGVAVAELMNSTHVTLDEATTALKPDRVAVIAYEYADALLKARGQQ